MQQKPKTFLLKWLLGATQPELESEQAPREFDPETSKTTASALPHSILVFTPDQEVQFDDEQKARYRKYLSMMPPVIIGQINFIPFESGHYHDGYFVRVFVRHARDLEEEFTLEPIPLSLVDARGDVVASGIFNPIGFGTLRFGETRLWTFAWKESEVLKRDPDLSAFSIRFENKGLGE